MVHHTHRKIVFLAMLLSVFACVNDKNFDPPTPNCEDDLVANISYAELQNLYKNRTIQIKDELIIEGYVVSSDEGNNFFSVLHFQDNLRMPTAGLQIEIDLRDSHLFYPVGSKIYIKLKGLYLGKSKDVFKIGGVFTSFGNITVGRLPASVVNKHIFVSCDDISMVEPTEISIEEINRNLTNTLVKLSDIEILNVELGETFAIAQEETKHILTDCLDNELVFLNSGFSDFQANVLPQNNGSITGILLREKEDYFLAIRTLTDIDFTKERCEDLVTEFSSTQIFISEIADPNNNAGARFIELYNSSNTTLILNGWMLNRYTNANTEVSAAFDLSEFSIPAHSTFVIAANAVEFENVYGIKPDVEATGNSAANSNGDDTMVLVDPFGVVIDIFGIVGEDGSGTNHEFEDGRALRKTTVTEGKPIYIFDEWIIYNDSGDLGTTNQPQNAPEDFTPGTHN